MIAQGPALPLQTGRWRLVHAVLAVVLLLGGLGCSKNRKAISEIHDAFSTQDYDETILLCEHALRRDVRDGKVYYYYGLALLAKGRDFEAIRRFDEAVAADSVLAKAVSDELLEAGREVFERGQKSRAASRLRAAVDYMAGANLGQLKYLVADVYFEDRQFADAERLYAEAVEAWPDTAAAEEAYFNLARSRIALADSTGALTALEMQLDRFPKGPLSGQAKFRLENLLYEHAQSEFVRGNYDTVIEEIGRLLERTTNRTLLQRARFLLGETYERLEDYQGAYQQYKAIIDTDRGASGRIVERARQKITAFQDSGLL
jgi:tetratricopeptide (TPR) repeat protein